MSLQVADLFASLSLKADEASWHKGEKLIESIKHGVEAFIGIEAIKKIGEMVEGTVAAAVGVERLSQKVGVGTAAIQELSYAADVSGATSEDLQVSLQHLARGMEELRTKGSGPAVDGFRALGVSMSEVRGKSPDDVLMTLADHFKTLPDGPRKTAAAMDLFGRSGTNLIPLLDRGSEGIADLRAEAEKLGIVIDEEGIKKAAEFEEQEKRLHATLTGLKNKAVEALLPAITKMVEGLSAWVKENRELIQSGIEVAVNAVTVAMQALAKAVGVVVDVIDFLREHGDLAQALLISLGAVITAVAVEAAAAWVIGFAPVAAVIAVIAGLVLVFKDLLRAIFEGKGVIATVVRWIADRFKGMGKAIVDAFKAVGRFFESVADAVKGAFVAVFDWIADKVAWAWDQVKKIGHYVTHPGDIVSDAADYFGGDDSTGGGPATPSATASRSVRSEVPPPVVYVDAPTKVEVTGNIPPDWVDTKVDKRVKQRHDETWRDADAETGGNDEADQ